ncbi:MAG: roadblock/LC7 domain-containing protein [Candidatus Eisenbacteria sp.]|nr:roadblock/LC7 domain-containing protein [Candidatus Eisenbacteria bacterium]
MVQIRWEGFAGNLVQLQEQLDQLRQSAGGRAVVLIDSAGRLLTLVGETPQFDLTTFVSLMAADFCATRELARILGEDNFHTVCHQGEEFSLYLTQVTEGTILATVFDRATTLGLVRYEVRRALPALGGTIREGYGDIAASSVDLEDGFSDEVLGRVDKLFGSRT